jgi:hypothetical protein
VARNSGFQAQADAGSKSAATPTFVKWPFFSLSMSSKVNRDRPRPSNEQKFQTPPRYSAADRSSIGVWQANRAHPQPIVRLAHAARRRSTPRKSNCPLLSRSRSPNTMSVNRVRGMFRYLLNSSIDTSPDLLSRAKPGGGDKVQRTKPDRCSVRNKAQSTVTRSSRGGQATHSGATPPCVLVVHLRKRFERSQTLFLGHWEGRWDSTNNTEPNRNVNTGLTL